MEIEFALDKQDWLTLAHYRAKHSAQFKKRENKFRWSYTFAFSLFALGTFLLEINIAYPITFIILAALSALFYPRIHKWRIKRYVENQVEETITPEHFAKRTIRLSAEGLELISENFENKYKWPLIDEVECNPINTFISIAGSFSIIISKTAVIKGDYGYFVDELQSRFRYSR